MTGWRSAALCALLSSSVAAAAEPQPAGTAVTSVVYPAYESSHDVRFNDLIDLLGAAMEATAADHGPYQVVPSTLKMNEARYLLELKSGQTLNVAWSSTSAEKERDFLPVRIPLRKGLLGYRVCLINRELQPQLDQVQTLDDLRRFTIGQGIGWGDVKLYEEAGFKVTAAQYEGLFSMVSLGRFDLFPRGINEVFREFDIHRARLANLALEQHLLLFYPWPYYFFFNRRDEALAKRVAIGLRRMIKDGSFDAIFWKYNGAAIEKADFKHRRVIRLPNTLLPKETPLDDSSLWFVPAKP
jgi:hypothetical protein